MLVGDECTPEHALYRVVHAHTRLENTEGPEASVLILESDSGRERKRTRCADQRTELSVDHEQFLLRLCARGLRFLRIRYDRGVE